MGGRVVDCARLESVYAARHPGFESPPIRQCAFACRGARFSRSIRAMRSGLILLGFLLCNAPAANSANPYVGNLLETAQINYQARRLDSALTKLDEHDKVKGKSGDALDLRGAIALEQGNFDAARKAFTEAHQLEPNLFAPRLHLGDLALREKKYAEAGAIYQLLLRETNVLISNERSRYGLLIVALATMSLRQKRRSRTSNFPRKVPPIILPRPPGNLRTAIMARRKNGSLPRKEFSRRRFSPGLPVRSTTSAGKKRSRRRRCSERSVSSSPFAPNDDSRSGWFGAP